ncbi:hypothetical protein BUE93_21900 [Chromobacterium amazonense]|uniref:Replication protein n=1 Tax=Chromobacterium amazonense TaxID=1382803 RepID=A0A2S9WYS3_9NEIS|nr:hypothetical protein BUE93_21900 [Chromobacterium amazonense]
MLQQFIQLPTETRQQFLDLLEHEARRDDALALLLTLSEQIARQQALLKQDMRTQATLRSKAEQRLALASRVMKCRQVAVLAATQPKQETAPDVLDCGPLRQWKSDGFSLELPLFALSSRDSCERWQWQNRDGSRILQVWSESRGGRRAHLHDRELLLYFCSQLCGFFFGKSHVGRSLPSSLRFSVSAFLRETGKDSGGKSYQAVLDSLQRLSQTRFQYQQQGKPIASYLLLQGWGKEEGGKIMVEMAPWLLDAIRTRQVLSVDPVYLRLRKPLARRMYELARKHCGHQAEWRIGLDSLHLKCGSSSSRREFRRMLKTLLSAEVFPGYQLALDERRDQLHCRNLKVSPAVLHPRLRQVLLTRKGGLPTRA